MYAQLTVGERLKIARKAMGLTQEELGEVINVKKSQISNIENGTSELTKANAIVLSGNLGIDADWLITGKGDMTSGSGGQHATAGRDITNLAGRDLRQEGNSSDLKALLEAANLRIRDLEARIKDKEEMIAFLKQQIKG